MKVRYERQLIIGRAPATLRPPDPVPMEQATFLDHVTSALARLFDEPYLQVHPLAQLIEPSGSHVPRGRALQRALLDAIQSLRPTSEQEGTDHAWRIYRYLFLRYAQVSPPLDVARQLAISERQARRTNQQALAAIASIIQDRYPLDPQGSSPIQSGSSDPAIRPPSGSSPHPPESASSNIPVGINALIDREVGHLAAENQRRTDLADVVSGLSPILHGLAERRRTTRTITIPRDLPRLALDRVIVRQIVLNLWTFGLDRGVTHLALMADEVGDEIALRLQLEPTDRATDDAIEDDTRVAIIRRLAESEDGRLEITWPPTAIRITAYLPIARPPLILIGDDSPEVIEVFRRYLETAGYAVLAAQCGDDIIRLARERQPAAITLDVMMPERDGWETLQILKGHPTTYSVPVIVCSVLREAELARFLGAAVLVPKPVTQPMLLDALIRCGLPPPM